MPDVQARPFRRADREQLTALVNAHIQELTRTARGWHHRSSLGSSPEATATPAPA